MSTARSIFTAGERETTCEFCPHRTSRHLRMHPRDAGVIAWACGATANECAHALDADVLSIRPRLSELVAMDLIEDTGDRRPNHRSGKPATVWRAKR